MAPQWLKLQRWSVALQQHRIVNHSHSQGLPRLGGVACAMFAGQSSKLRNGLLKDLHMWNR